MRQSLGQSGFFQQLRGYLAAQALATALVATGLAQAQTGPIQIVVPVAAGGGTDLLARSLGQKLGTALNQTVVVDNKVGAGGNIGVEFVTQSRADGRTLLVSPSTIATNVAVYRKLPYDLLKDLQAVSVVAQTGVVLVVHPSVPAKTLAEFVQLAKGKAGALNYGSAGLGSPQQLHAEFFNQLAGLRTHHIPYKGQSQAMTDLVGGQLSYMFSPIQNALPFIQQGRIRALAVAAPARNLLMGDVPTFAEGGYAGVDLSNWFAVFAPAGTPVATVHRLNRALTAIGRTPEMREKLDKLGFEPIFNTPDAATDFLRAELVRWARVAAYAGIKAE